MRLDSAVEHLDYWLENDGFSFAIFTFSSGLSLAGLKALPRDQWIPLIPHTAPVV